MCCDKEEGGDRYVGLIIGVYIAIYLLVITCYLTITIVNLTITVAY